MRKTLLILFVLASLLASCNVLRTPRAPVATSTAPPDAVATQVSRMLTNEPTATFTEAARATVTLALPISATETTAPSETPIPADTGTPTPQAPTSTPLPPTRTPTATTNPDDPKAALGSPTWQTNFSEGNPFGTIDNENTRIRVDEGKMLLTGVKDNGWMGWSLTFSQKPKDFYLEATMKTADCGGNDRYGVMFRAPDVNGGYFFGLTCSGKFFLRAGDFAKGNDFYPLPATASAEIHAGSNQTNVIGVMAKGDTFTFYANGKKIGETTDGTFKDQGYIGLFVSSAQTTNFTVTVEKVSLWNLP